MQKDPLLDEIRERLQLVASAAESVDARLVFGDWLQSVGHSWGELISLQHALSSEKNKKRRTKLRNRESELLDADPCGMLDIIDEDERFTWRAGFVDRATLRACDADELVEWLGRLLVAPGAAALLELSLDLRPESLPVRDSEEASDGDIIDPWAPVLEFIAGTPAPQSVRRLSFGASPPEPITAYVRMPDFGAISRAKWAVREIAVAGAARPGTEPFDLPETVSLEVRFGVLDPVVLGALAHSTLPKLERLSIWPGGTASVSIDENSDDEDYDDDDDDEEELDHEHFEITSFDGEDLDDLEPTGVGTVLYGDPLSAFLANVKVPSLRELGVQSAVLNADVCTTIARSAVLGRLTRLDLSGCELVMDGADVLIAEARRFAHLERIDLRRIGLAATDAQIAALKKALPNALVEKKREPRPDFFLRYVTSVE